jgi:hypothetical protein
MKADDEGAAVEGKSLRGFALLDVDVRREIARSGGRAAQKSEKVRRWTPETAREMAPLGGAAVRDKRRATESIDGEH